MKQIKRIVLSVLIIILLTIIFYFISNIITKTTGNAIYEGSSKNQFDNCLKQQDITLYINSNYIPETLSQTKMGEKLQYIKIFNCLDNNQFCLDKNINSFPTWIINTNKINKDISISELSKYSGC